MEKTILSLLLICLTLFTLTGCKYELKTKNKATDEEVVDFFEEKNIDDIFRYNVSFNFKMTYTEEKVIGVQEETTKMKVKGRASLNLNTYEGETYYKGSLKSKGTSYINGYKEKFSSKVKEEIVQLEDGKTYLSVDRKDVFGESRNRSNIKTRDEDDSVLSVYVVEYLSNALSGIGSKGAIYIDGDDCVIISSTKTNHFEIVLLFDDDELEAMQYSVKTAESKLEVTIEFGEIKEIKKPSNSSKYQ